MKILEQIRKAHDRLIKHIEQSIDLLEIDPENTNVKSFYIHIDDLSYVLSIIKHKQVYFVWFYINELYRQL